MTTRAQARDLILTMFKTSWDALSSPPAVYYDDFRGDLPAATLPWVRVIVQTLAGAQMTLGGPGGRQFDHSGIVTVQVFTPAGDGLDAADQWAQAAIDAFEGQSTAEIWFKNVGATDVGEDGDWYQTNVKGLFLYTSRK